MTILRLAWIPIGVAAAVAVAAQTPSTTGRVLLIYDMERVTSAVAPRDVLPHVLSRQLEGEQLLGRRAA